MSNSGTSLPSRKALAVGTLQPSVPLSDQETQVPTAELKQFGIKFDKKWDAEISVSVISALTAGVHWKAKLANV